MERLITTSANSVVTILTLTRAPLPGPVQQLDPADQRPRLTAD